MRARIAALALCTIAAGCASYDWRDASGELASDAVVTQCQQSARLAALRMASSGTRTVPVPTRDGATVLMPSPVPERDPLLEQEYLSRCMRDKGYSLVRREQSRR